MDLELLRYNLQTAAINAAWTLERQLSTPTLLRHYRKAVLEYRAYRAELLRKPQLAQLEPDRYDRIADRTSSLYWLLRNRGVEPCEECLGLDGAHELDCLERLALNIGAGR